MVVVVIRILTCILSFVKEQVKAYLYKRFNQETVSIID
jgi:hypothetical protein